MTFKCKALKCFFLMPYNRTLVSILDLKSVFFCKINQIYNKEITVLRFCLSVFTLYAISPITDPGFGLDPLFGQCVQHSIQCNNV